MITEARAPSSEVSEAHRWLMLDFTKKIHVNDDYAQYTTWLRQINDRMSKLDESFRASSRGSVTNRIFLAEIKCKTLTFSKFLSILKADKISVVEELDNPSQSDVQGVIMKHVNRLMQPYGDANDFGHR